MLEIDVGQVDVWLLSLDQIQQAIAEPSSLLSHDELAKAHRLLAKKHQQMSLASRAGLRWILSHYLAQSPEQFQFEILKHGKPVLAESEMQFNVSHSRDQLCYVITRGQAIGVDIEIAKTRNFCGLINRFFSDDEINAFNQLPSTQHQQAFFHIWTQKEAFIKAVGQGLSLGLNNFSVSVLPPGKCLSYRFGDAQDWQIDTWQFDDLYLAICVNNPQQHPLQFNFISDINRNA